MSWTHAGQYGPNDLRRWDPVSQQLTYPTSIQVNQQGISSAATIYTDMGRSAALTNPVPLNVSANAPGVDVNGNLLFFAEPGFYDALVDGTTYTVHVPPHPQDVAALAGSILSF